MWLDYELFLTLAAVRNDLANILINPLMFLSAKCYSCAVRLLIMWVCRGLLLRDFSCVFVVYFFCLFVWLFVCLFFLIIILFFFWWNMLFQRCNKGICQVIRNIYTCFQTPNIIFLLKRTLELYLNTRISACVHVVPS